MLVVVLLVVAGVVVLGALVARTAARARRFGRARERLVGALAAGVRALPAVRRTANGRVRGDGIEPDTPAAR